MFALLGMVLAALLVVGLTSAANPSLPPSGTFELDGNGFTTPTSTLADWNCLFLDPTTNPVATNCPATQPPARTFKTDPVLDSNDDILGGGSKDILPISQWNLVSQKPPAKDDIAHAAWANYDSNGHDIIYFAADRISNNGNAYLGFWFFKGSVGETGGSISGEHQVGDTLVLVNFIQGNGSATDSQEIGVYEWVGTGGDINGGTLQTVVPLTEAECVGSDASINACAQFNTTNQPSVWPFQSADSGDAANVWTPSEFVEGGVDLTSLFPNGTPCFTSAMAETRSSSSPTAEQKDIVFGQLATCGTIKIVKDAVPDNAQSFGFHTADDLLPSPGTFSLVDNGTSANTNEIDSVKAGTYHVSEDANPAGWQLSQISCDDATSNSSWDLNTRTATINVGVSETVTCTFTNTKTPLLTVTKACVPTTDAGKFNLKVDTTVVTTDAACGTGTGSHEYTVGAHTVSETQGTGTSLANYTSVIGGDCAPDGTITLAAGDNKTCTITNTRAAKLTVNKVCAPTTDTGKFNLQIDGSTAGTGANASCAGTTGAVTVSAGPHTVGETGGTGTTLSDYTSVISGDCAANGSITLAAGDNKSCTITNTRRPKLTLNKVCAPTTDTGVFNLRVDEATVTPDAACGAGTGAQFYSIGAHTVAETAGTGTSLASYTSVISGDCSAAGAVTLAAGDNKSCTITNTRKPTLTVNKVCNPSTDSGKFNLQIDGATAGTGANAACGGSTGAVVSTIGSHTVGETAGTGTNLTTDYATAEIGGACAANGSVTLTAGQNAICTITNSRKGAIAITKTPATQAVDSGGTANFTITVTNTGTVTLTNVTVTDPLSAGCAKTIGTLTAGQSSTYTCSQPNVTAAFTNVATVTGHPPVGPDVTASASANVTVNSPPPSTPSAPTPTPTPAPTVVDLAIVKTPVPVSVVRGSNVTYTLTVTNNGPVTDTAVQIGDSLPFGVSYVSATSSQGTCSGTAVVQCAIGTMTNGQKVTITIVVNTTNTGTIVNTATVVGALPETTLTNNSSSTTINVTAPPAPKPAPPVFKPPVVKPAPKLVPPPCYAVVVAPKSLTVGKNAHLQLHVTAKNKAIAGVKIEVKGAGILKLSGRTNSAGQVTITLHPKKSGIVLVKPASYKGCANPRIGVIAAFTPPVTGSQTRKPQAGPGRSRRAQAPLTSPARAVAALGNGPRAGLRKG
jgi:uncharacterized repeat protein (TIGR01451 family)